MSDNSNFTIKTVATQEAADEIVQLLLAHGVNSEVVKEEFSVIPAYSDGVLSSNLDIKINSTDKTKAEEILKKRTEQFLNEIDPEHYLFSFTDKELLDVLSHKYEWSEIDLQLSAKILEDRGVEINHAEINLANQESFEELAEPKKGSELWIVLGYVFAFLGGLLGLVIAYSVYKAKRKLPDGTFVHDYDKATRSHALNIFIISLIVLVVVVIIRFTAIPM